MPDSGLPRSDAKADFARERRRRALASIAERMRREPDDVGVMLPFEEVVAALGRRSQVDLGVKPIPLDSIVGTVDRRKADFDRSFRPASTEMRSRWERIAAARRRGEPMPPIDVFRIGELHFVQDGHHRVSVARALGDTDINAHVIEVKTKLGADRALQMRDLPLKRHERVFFERVPLPPAARKRIQLTDEWRYAQLGTLVEGWGYRASLDRGAADVPRRDGRGVVREEYEPVVTAIGRRVSAAPAPRPSGTCGSPCSATCCSRRTTGTTRWWSACWARRASPARARTRWSTSC